MPNTCTEKSVCLGKQLDTEYDSARKHGNPKLTQDKSAMAKREFGADWVGQHLRGGSRASGQSVPPPRGVGHGLKYGMVVTQRQNLQHWWLSDARCWWHRNQSMQSTVLVLRGGVRRTNLCSWTELRERAKIYHIKYKTRDWTANGGAVGKCGVQTEGEGHHHRGMLCWYNRMLLRVSTMWTIDSGWAALLLPIHLAPRVLNEAAATTADRTCAIKDHIERFRLAKWFPDAWIIPWLSVAPGGHFPIVLGNQTYATSGLRVHFGHTKTWKPWSVTPSPWRDDLYGKWQYSTATR